MCRGKIRSAASAIRAEGTSAAVANDLIQTTTSEPDFLKKVITEINGGSRQGCQTHFHQGPHQLHGCLQRAKCNVRTV